MIQTYLEVAKLGELLSAVVKLAGERLDLLMHYFVGAYVATLRKGLATDVALVGALARVSPLVGLVHGSEQVIMKAQHGLTFKFPSCEKRCPHAGSLQTKGLTPVCARV